MTVTAQSYNKMRFKSLGFKGIWFAHALKVLILRVLEGLSRTRWPKINTSALFWLSAALVDGRQTPVCSPSKRRVLEHEHAVSAQGPFRRTFRVLNSDPTHPEQLTGQTNHFLLTTLTCQPILGNQTGVKSTSILIIRISACSKVTSQRPKIKMKHLGIELLCCVPSVTPSECTDKVSFLSVYSAELKLH